MAEENEMNSQDWPDTPVIAGALHYFRVHPDQWADRLARLASMG
ncbi:MAG: hypothetical protein WA971_12495 [Microbacterium sp.]